MTELFTFSLLQKHTPLPGLIRQSKSGKTMTVALFTFNHNVAVPVHTHDHEQISIVIRGTLRYSIDGEEIIATPNQFVIIPSHVPHGAVATSTDGATVIDIFSPPRDDFEQ